jgi:Tol biopolymer transport system component
MSELRDRLQTTLGGGYRVTEELAGGGMSRVFVAEETELGRAVVVKVLPPDLGAGLNVDRFRREIQLAARLQHPHIVPLLSAGSRGGLLYYTMPLIEGQTLRARLARSGELPIPEALRVLRDVADALEYAHAHGVVHRDIKPENVMISGHHALVTDFGVSKALSSATGEQSLTSIGVALGTPTYMSPEQATADPMMDHRTDIYALGILAYELLTGHPPFSGGTPQQVLAAQVTQTPEPITKHRPHVPPQLAALIMRCLEKKPADRWQGAHEVREQLEALATPSGGTVPIKAATIEGQRTARLLKREIVLGSVAAAVLLIALLASRYFGNGDSAAFAVGGTHQVTNDPGIEITPALSPDGRLLAYAAGTPFETHIYVTQVSGGQPVEVARGLGRYQRAPRWSPDASRLVFVGPEGIYVVPALGGRPRRIIASDASQPFIAPTWSRDGQSLAYAGVAGNIYIADAEGRNSRILFNARFPHSIEWSPDDSRIAFVNGNAPFIYLPEQFANIAPSAIWVVGRDGKNPVRVTDEVHMNMSPVWTAGGEGLLYMSNTRGGRDIYYQRIGRSGTLRGQPERLTTGLSVNGISASADGRSVAYSTLSTSVAIWTLPVPTGTASISAARQLTSANERVEMPRVSPDGEWLAFDSDRAGNADIYRMPARGGEAEQLTRDPADEFRPAWSPDGRQIAYHSWRSGSRDSYVMAADGSSPRLIAGGPSHEWAGVFSPDGNWIAFPSDRGERAELYIVRTSGGSPRLLAGSLIRTSSGWLWSSDGRWILNAIGSELQLLSPQGGPPQTIARAEDFGGSLAELGGFSADGRTAYVRVLAPDGSAHIGAVGIDGSNPRIVVRFDDPNRQAYRPEFSTDGRDFYFTIGKHEADIWVMELQKK